MRYYNSFDQPEEQQVEAFLLQAYQVESAKYCFCFATSSVLQIMHNMECKPVI